MTAFDLINESAAPVRCAAWTREQGVDPIGSIGSPRAFLFVEWPLPWPHDLGEIPELAGIRGDLAAAGARLQGLVPPADAVQERHVIFYDRPNGPFTRYTTRELVVGPDDVIRAVGRLLAGEGQEIVPGTRSDVMVCTHGRRDRCCGSLGTALALSLIAQPDVLGPRAQVRRTSHTGGHRFAPTAMVFPEGTAWAFADLELLARVVRREGPVTDLLAAYRGGSGLGSPHIQVLERAVLGEVGWDLLDRPRWGTEQGDGVVDLHVQGPGGTEAWEARIATGRTLRVPDCGSPLADARKTSTESLLTDLHRLP